MITRQHMTTALFPPKQEQSTALRSSQQNTHDSADTHRLSLFQYQIIQLGLRGEEGSSFEARQGGGERGRVWTVATVQSVQQRAV